MHTRSLAGSDSSQDLDSKERQAADMVSSSQRRPRPLPGPDARVKAAGRQAGVEPGKKEGSRGHDWHNILRTVAFQGWRLSTTLRSMSRGIFGTMQQNGLPKLFRRSDFNKDSVSMMLEKLPPTKEHEGDYQIYLFALKGYSTYVD